MEQYVIRGGNPLVGEVEIGGAKNAALAILTAATMTDETVLIENLPDVSDINVLLEAIAEIGATVDRIDRHTVRINAATIGDLSVDYEYIKKIRASYYLLGALLGKYKRAEVPLPGGCNMLEIQKQFPNCKAVASVLRNLYTVEDGDWMGIYLKDGKFYESPVHKVHSFEAVGAGDAFGAGLIHAMAHDFAPQRTIDFAISASVLKLMIQHDANVVSEKEIEQIMKQGGTNLQR